MYPSERDEIQQETARLLRNARARIWKEAAKYATKSAEEFKSDACRELGEYFTYRAQVEDMG